MPGTTSSCPACSTQLSGNTRFCPQCGKPARVDPDSVETVAVGPASGSQMRSHMHTSSAHANGDQRFPPGMLVASRYRIISRLGKGGMGEVFRADDLILGQQVALKFLPETAKSNINLLTRFYDEVRIARQISHKNVCRVYDIGEIDGLPYLSMEYIDGEDLGSLLRRIGRLPADKATEFARKMCAGIAAAHAQGVLHRDIKPGNIMIDARGELRVTDFGLAALADQLQGAEIRNGTPAYMAPEQLSGKEVSVQSDLYAVGLVLYEMFTGKLPFKADTVAEIARMREENRVTNPSTLVSDLDKTVERAILRCLDADPKLRPASALALAASLPGGDPLAAALADGETPSPEAVAAAGSTEGLNPKIAMSALAVFAVGLAVFAFATPRLHLINRVPMENPPDVLAAKARDIVKSAGYTERPADTATGFYSNTPYINYMRPKVKTRDEWMQLMSRPPAPLGFWYRQSPRPLVTDNRSAGQVTLDEPFPSLPGMILVGTDLDGRLRHFTATPPEREPEPERKGPADWTPLFAAAGIDPEKLKPADPEWTPVAVTDARAAWTGPYMDRTDVPIRVEAASFHGRPIYFSVIWPWTRPTRTPNAAGTSSLVTGALVVIVLLAAMGVARYNWRAGRSDPRSAVVIGLYCAGASLLSWAVSAHHVSSQSELQLAADALSDAAFLFALFWLIYLALEPWVRRYWPQTMITWTRLLAGRWRDPLVGRDILFGAVCGIVYCLLIQAFELIAIRLGAPAFGTFSVGNLMGTRAAATTIAKLLSSALTGGLQLFLLLFLLRALLRKQWIAGLVFMALFTFNQTAQAQASRPSSGALLVVTALLYAMIYGILVLIMLRLGFFALMATLFVVNSTTALFLTTDFGAWYGASSLIAVIVISAFALWGFRLSLAGRPLFGDALAK